MVRIKKRELFPPEFIRHPSTRASQSDIVEKTASLFFRFLLSSLVSENSIESFVKDKGFRFSMAQQSKERGEKRRFGWPLASLVSGRESRSISTWRTHAKEGANVRRGERPLGSVPNDQTIRERQEGGEKETEEKRKKEGWRVILRTPKF